MISFLDGLINKQEVEIVNELKFYCKGRGITNNSAEKITRNFEITPNKWILAKSVAKNVKDLILSYGLEQEEKEIAPRFYWMSIEKNINYILKRRSDFVQFDLDLFSGSQIKTGLIL